jgi:hypothetical protein
LAQIRQRMKHVSALTAENTEAARAQGAAAELTRLIDRHDQGLTSDDEFAIRKGFLEGGT